MRAYTRRNPSHAARSSGSRRWNSSRWGRTTVLGLLAQLTLSVSEQWSEMSAFTEPQLAYLTGERRLARIATVGIDGTPHVVPVGFSYNREHDTIDVGGRQLEQTKKFHDVARSGRAAIVVDDLASTNPWHPRAIEVRGPAEAISGPDAVIRIHAERIISWGLDNA